MAKHRFRSRTNRKTLFELLSCSLRYPRKFRIKAFHMLLFLLEKALWNKEREIGIAMTGFLKATIQIALDIFPKLITLRTEHDAAPYRRVIHKLCFFNNIYIPSGEIFALRRDFCNELFILRHVRLFPSNQS